MDSDTPQDGYLIKRRGYFFRPASKGYTGVVADAGRYTLEKAQSYADSVDGVTFVHESELTSPYYNMSPHDISEYERVQGRERISRLETAYAVATPTIVRDALLAEEYDDQIGAIFWAEEATPKALGHAAELLGVAQRDDELRDLASNMKSMDQLSELRGVPGNPEIIDRIKAEIQERAELHVPAGATMTF